MMELDPENNKPKSPYIGQFFKDKSGQRWVYVPDGHWIKAPRLIGQYIMTTFDDGSIQLSDNVLENK